MSENNNKLKSLDEIVFEGRNKAYGAYDMRMTEKSTLLKAFIRGFIVIAILAFALIASATGMFNSKKTEEVIVDVQLEDLNIPDTPPEEEVVEPEPEPEPEPEQRFQEETAQVKVIMPEPKAQPKKEETVPEVKEMANKDLGLVDREGPKSTTQVGGANEVNTNKEAPKDTPNPGKATEPAPTAPSTVTARTAAVMAVYPGCEKEAAKGKDAATKCLSDRLSRDLQDELQDFANDQAGQGTGVVSAKLTFQIDTEGRIVGISPMGDAKLGPEARKALERITQRQQRRGKTIKPAQTEDGRAAKLNFNIPVKMQIE